MLYVIVQHSIFKQYVFYLVLVTITVYLRIKVNMSTMSHKSMYYNFFFLQNSTVNLIKSLRVEVTCIIQCIICNIKNIMAMVLFVINYHTSIQQ